MSPLAPDTTHQIVTVTPEALVQLATLRDTEPDADRLGLRLEIVSKPGEDFQYDLSFDVVTKAGFSDEVRTHTADGITVKVIIAANSIDLLEGATLDHTSSAGLVIRNPNKPLAPLKSRMNMSCPGHSRSAGCRTRATTGSVRSHVATSIAATPCCRIRTSRVRKPRAAR